MNRDKIFTKTKIIGTVGPASIETAMLEKMIHAGLDIVRLNFSHGDYEFHGQAVANVKEAAARTGRPIAILADLCGPKIRLGDLENEIPVAEGEELIITTEKCKGTRECVPTAYKKLAEDVTPGDTILIDDGLIRLEVLATDQVKVSCKVMNDGVLKSRKGLNLPGVKVSASSISEKDKQDLEFIISHPIDFVALSFVRNRDDIKELRWLMKDRGKTLPIIAKIEKPEAIADLDGIIAEADIVMVARGDLGVEMPTQEVPILQKMIIEKCNQANTPVITATQMLESMITNPRPTRAEASDVANAVFDGTDAVMLSAETSVGVGPANAVRIMDQVVSAAEGKPALVRKGGYLKNHGSLTDSESICHAACRMAEEAEAAAIIVITKRGRTARMLSKYRVSMPILAFAENEDVIRSLSILWGVEGLLMDNVGETDATIQKARKQALDLGFVSRGDKVVYVAGIPLIESPSTNMLKIETI